VNADAVDMESFHVFNLTHQLSVPAVAIRAVSDATDTRMPLDFNRFITGNGEIGWLPAIREVAKAPGQIPQLIRFGVESSRAARNLAQFLDGYVSALAETWPRRAVVSGMARCK
jgi:hypothetical protein